MGTPGGLNILLVEDHPDTAALIKAYLERSGYTVATAGTCQEALAHPRLSRIQALICDIGLPDGSGWDLLPRLRAHARDAYAVAITARGHPNDEARSRAAGFQAHLPKPFAPNQLVELLKGCPAGGGASGLRR